MENTTDLLSSTGEDTALAFHSSPLEEAMYQGKRKKNASCV